MNHPVPKLAREPRVRSGRHLAAGLVLAAGAAVPGCATSTPSTDRPESAEAAAAPSPASDVNAASARLEQMFASLNSTTTTRGAGPGTPTDPWGQRGRALEAPGTAPNPDISPPPAINSAQPPGPGAMASPQSSLDTRAVDAASFGPPSPTHAGPHDTPADLVAALDALSADSALPAPVAQAYRLAIAEALRPGTLRARLDAARAALDPAEAARVEALSSLLAAFLSDSTPDETIVRTLNSHAAALSPEQHLRLPTATLVSRVDGFGKTRPFPGSPPRFLAGRAHPVLVYVEVAGFATQQHAAGSSVSGPTPAAPEWTIDLTQELRLFHDADGVLAWHSRPQPARDVSQRRRTDHYLVQRITLPATLTVGAYNLKVIIRDAGNGHATAEAVIPFQLVADPALVGR